MSKSPPSILLENLSVWREGALVLKDINVKIGASKLTAIIGPNGAGKTTLLLALLGIIPYSGKISFLDDENKPFLPRISYVPQALTLERQSPLTVLEFMALDRQTRPVWLGISREIIDISISALKRLSVEHLADRRLGKLSGGEIQRVFLAKALQREPELLLLDEPVSGVDIIGGHLFCDVLEAIRSDRNMTVLMVSHDLSVVSRHASHVLCINRSLTCQGETPKILNSENLLEIYGIHSGLYQHRPNKEIPLCDFHPRHDC